MRKHAVVLLASILAVGCQTTLDIRQAELLRAWGEGNRAFANSIDAYRQVMDSIATRYHQDQQNLRDTKWDLWLSQQTSDDGSLVYRAADGSIQPMLVAQLREALALRDTASMTITESRRTWADADARIRRAIEDFKKMTNVAMETNDDIAEAKKSAQQFIDSALSALAGFAGGIGIGAAVNP